jgi:hypothetical protein
VLTSTPTPTPTPSPSPPIPYGVTPTPTPTPTLSPPQPTPSPTPVSSNPNLYFKGFNDNTKLFKKFGVADWSGTKTGTGSILNDTALFDYTYPFTGRIVNGHVIFSADGSGLCTVIESTGTFRNTYPLGNKYPISIQNDKVINSTLLIDEAALSLAAADLASYSFDNTTGIIYPDMPRRLSEPFGDTTSQADQTIFGFNGIPTTIIYNG